MRPDIEWIQDKSKDASRSLSWWQDMVRVLLVYIESLEEELSVERECVKRAAAQFAEYCERLDAAEAREKENWDATGEWQLKAQLANGRNERLQKALEYQGKLLAENRMLWKERTALVVLYEKMATAVERLTVGNVAHTKGVMTANLSNLRHATRLHINSPLTATEVERVKALEQQVERMEQEKGRLLSIQHEYNLAWNEAEDRVKTLEQQVERLREAINKYLPLSCGDIERAGCNTCHEYGLCAALAGGNDGN